ncbi:hypothetical protein Pla52o_54800 [Novipirellula galeiformis]|uniref:Prepilin-type N-terminal cleavage/methylation domain-containing protein n=1 Tax=Novipirellula galeiformis TaxID=2528004 RepID=A0A5C6C0H5_9BACT|nr:hypothetical protein [Novipirellula galeiformis]TWU17141.1 hypothetical protein Pla52o_54800 [Novipirellula galeiformis]
MLCPPPAPQDAKPASRFASENSSRSRPAFTLLELVIVLLVMVGIMAVVWPNLQRPLRRTTLDEAAEMLRDAIDQSRYQASLSGTPYFVQLRQGRSEIYSGTFDSFMAAGDTGFALNDSASAVAPVATSQSRNAPLATPPPAAVRAWRLPTTVVVSQVRWTLAAPSDPPFDSGPGEGGLPNDNRLDPPQRQSDSLPGTSGASLGAEDRQWWLPLSATGQGRDATIELYDTSIQETLRVTYASVTGALEIAR